ncbi:MAG: transcriptional repressor [Tannerella sp.]|jgi:Fur family ferric uptake transcriptional regulator|nr:transcriptional repressor [Tannerella sp.]
MNITNTEPETIEEAFSEYLKSKNLRHTIERDAIFGKIYNTDEPFTPEMLRQKLEDENFRVSKASIYNTIELLLDAKIIVRHQFTNSLVQYELKHLSEGYAYLICTHCDRVRKIREEKINNFLDKLKISKFTSEYYSLYFYGICSRCKYMPSRNK